MKTFFAILVLAFPFVAQVQADTLSGALIGGVAGAIIGNNTHGGRHQGNAIIAGSLIGAMIGSEQDRYASGTRYVYVGPQYYCNDYPAYYYPEYPLYYSYGYSYGNAYRPRYRTGHREYHAVESHYRGGPERVYHRTPSHSQQFSHGKWR